MANDNHHDPDEGAWVEDRLRSLEPPPGFQADRARVHARLRERRRRAASSTRRLRLAAASAVALAGLLAFPGPRATAQRLWNHLTLARVAVVEVDRPGVSAGLAAVFAMEPQPFDQSAVASADEAARLAGFRPVLPPAAFVNEDPVLSVVDTVTLSTRPLVTADIARALAAAGVTDVEVPADWEGTTLVAEGGPLVVAEYAEFELIQAAPFRMTTPAAVEFGRFMELAFRVFGRDAAEARALGRRFAANPALVMHFPERGSVRDVPLRAGTGVYVGDPDGSEGICFFWTAGGRIFIVSADHLTETRAAALADSLE